MLGKTANGLTWMARHIERADNVVRLVEAGQRIALTRQGQAADEWQAILTAAGSAEGYAGKHDEVRARHVVDWLLVDRDNPSAVRPCVEMARMNARVVRTAITREVWEAINDFHLDMGEALARPVTMRDLPDLLARIRRHGAMVRGMFDGTMLRNDISDFAALGTFMERADATARILDVKYHVLLPRSDAVGAELDTAQWEQLLRSVHVHRAFMMVHGTDYTAANVADFLILDERMPRSLRFCAHRIAETLVRLGEDHPGGMDPRNEAANLYRELRKAHVDSIIEGGLHEYLTRFLERLGHLSGTVAATYRFTA